MKSEAASELENATLSDSASFDGRYEKVLQYSSQSGLEEKQQHF